MQLRQSRQAPVPLDFHIGRGDDLDCRFWHIQTAIQKFIVLHVRASDRWGRHPGSWYPSGFCLFRSGHFGLLSDVSAGPLRKSLPCLQYWWFSGCLVNRVLFCPDFRSEDWNDSLETNIILAVPFVSVYSLQPLCVCSAPFDNFCFACRWTSPGCCCAEILISGGLGLRWVYSSGPDPLL